MLDIIFISYDEPNADENFTKLKLRFPHAKRVHGVTGIANAHIAAAKKSLTRFFYVVDGDADIANDFDFSFVPRQGEEEFVHIWHAYNPAIGLDYGYGGVKLFNKEFFKNIKSHIDFTTTLTKDIKIHTQIACITRFNSDTHRAYRGAFRESAKLQFTINDKTKPESVRKEAEFRLRAWLNPLTTCAFRDYVRAGAIDALAEMEKHDDFSFINVPEVMKAKVLEKFKEVDFSTDPIPKPNHPMKHEFFFINRIASAMYDPFVMENLPITELRDAISDGQLLSKNWLIEEMRKLFDAGILQPGVRVAILGGWIGTLSLLMKAWELPVEIVSIDLDERANRIAEKLNYDSKFSTRTESMYDVDYSDFDVLINTSSEHIEDIRKWRQTIPDNKLVIVQNNNFTEIEDHISCVENSDELRQILDLKQVYYEGTRKFIMYSRFMIIGRT